MPYPCIYDIHIWSHIFSSMYEYHLSRWSISMWDLPTDKSCPELLILPETSVRRRKQAEETRGSRREMLVEHIKKSGLTRENASFYHERCGIWAVEMGIEQDFVNQVLK